MEKYDFVSRNSVKGKILVVHSIISPSSSMIPLICPKSRFSEKTYIEKENIARIAKRCPESITYIVKSGIEKWKNMILY